MTNGTKDSSLPDGDTTDDKDDGEADAVRELLDLVTQETRFTLIQNIVAHPKEKPSLKELAYANPSKSKSTVRNHLDKLQNAGVVETVTLPSDKRQRNLPHRFYRLTDWAREFLEEHELLRAEETLKQMHSMLEKTPEIEKYIEARRPDEEDSTDDSEDTTRKAKP